MYNVTPLVKEAWSRLFAQVFLDLDLEVDIIDHPWPAPIESLWSRPDLLCSFMCGWPFINSPVAMKPIAVPVPSLQRYQNQSRYCSEFLARADSGWTSLPQGFGHRFGYMTSNSQSGFNAPRGALAPFSKQCQGAVFSSVQGPLDTPARALGALRDNQVDLIALDSFYLDLLRAHRPQALEGLTSVAATPFTPMPLLVAADAAPDTLVAALASKLTGLHHEPQYSAMLSQVLVSRFEIADRDQYQVLNQIAAVAEQLDYPTIR